MSAWSSTLHYSLVRGILATGVGNRADFVIIVIIIQGLLTAVVCTTRHHRGIGLQQRNLLFVSVVCGMVGNRSGARGQASRCFSDYFLFPRNLPMPLPSLYYPIPISTSSASKVGRLFLIDTFINSVGVAYNLHPRAGSPDLKACRRIRQRSSFQNNLDRGSPPITLKESNPLL